MRSINNRWNYFPFPFKSIWQEETFGCSIFSCITHWPFYEFISCHHHNRQRTFECSFIPLTFRSVNVRVYLEFAFDKDSFHWRVFFFCLHFLVVLSLLPFGASRTNVSFQKWTLFNIYVSFKCICFCRLKWMGIVDAWDGAQANSKINNTQKKRRPKLKRWIGIPTMGNRRTLPRR